MPGVTAIRSEETGDWRLETGNWGREDLGSAVAVFGVSGDGRRVKLPYGDNCVESGEFQINPL
jgi:hypothetical protein